ncbi:unnamed protein product [Euphydryas editha]|uniref:Uncharacterized protein n=1 Tax=Euphydryas editha TaxID=104508 RepID=A0AAU9U1N9_EUPED|nr:unnamed protein product [Euphydryas editha]
MNGGMEKGNEGVSQWRLFNLIQFKPNKKQVCAFAAKTLQFEGTPLTASASIGILGVDTSRNVQFRGHLKGKAKLASKKLGVLGRVK